MISVPSTVTGTTLDTVFKSSHVHIVGGQALSDNNYVSGATV